MCNYLLRQYAQRYKNDVRVPFKILKLRQTINENQLIFFYIFVNIILIHILDIEL